MLGANVVVAVAVGLLVGQRQRPAGVPIELGGQALVRFPCRAMVRHGQGEKVGDHARHGPALGGGDLLEPIVEAAGHLQSATVLARWHPSLLPPVSRRATPVL